MSNSLYSDFIKYYDQFEKFTKDEKLYDVGKHCLTLFGVSGAGKSTFLSRLKSKMDPEEFFDTVIKRSDERITVEEVTIGRSISSVTIVPRMHRIAEFSIYDVPGFKDTDENRKIIINVLHKCLLNHIKHNKFIAVLRLDLIEEERMTQLIGDYYDSFAELFGKNYRKSIENVYFIITHYDKHSELTLEKIQVIMKEKVFSSIDLEKDQLSYFLKRLLKKHIVVNYKEDTRESLIGKLEELLKNEEGDGISQSELTITKLDVFENELNKRLNKDLEEFLKSTEQESSKTWSLLTKKKEEVEKSVQEIKKYLEGLDQIKAELELVNEFLQNVDKTIDVIKKKNDTLEFEKKSLLKDNTSIEAILDVLERTVKEEVMIHVRADVAQKASFGGYYVDNIINIDPAIYKERIILITRLETDDETLKNYLNNGTIIPDDIEKIRLFQSDIVLYNNNIFLSKNIKVDSTYSDNTKQLKVSAKCDIPFKLYLYYTEDLGRSQIYKKIKKQFANKIQENKQRYEALDAQLKQNLHEIETTKLKDASKRSRKEELQNKQTEYNSRVKTSEQNLNQLKVSINEEINKQERFLSSIKTQDLYVTGTKILKIFNNNKLSSNISDQIKKSDKLVDDQRIKLVNFKESLLMIQDPNK